MRRLLNLRLENVGRHAALELDLAGITAAAIVGPNGAGKTTILRAIRWALYGTSPVDLMRYDADRMRVVVEVEQGGSRWRITRGKEAGRSATLALERHGRGDRWTPLTQRTNAETQLLIREHVTGLTAKQSDATMFSAQGQCGLLASLDPADAKRLLGSLLELERWEEWRKEVAARRRALNSDLERRDAAISELDSQIDHLERTLPDVEELQRACSAAEEALRGAKGGLVAAREAERARDAVRERENLLAQLRVMRERRDRARRASERRTELVALLADGPGVRERFAAADEQRLTYGAAVASYEERRRLAEGEQRALAKRVHVAESAASAARAALRGAELALRDAQAALRRLDDTVDPTCPTCGQDIHDAALARTRADLEGRIAEREGAYAETTAAAQERQADVELQREAAGAIELPGAPESNGHDHSAWEAAHAAIDHLTRLQGEYNALGAPEDIEAMRPEYDRLQARVKALPREAPAALPVAEAEGAVEEAQSSLRRAGAAAAVAAEQEASLLRLRAQRATKVAQLPELRSDAETLAILEQACSYKGVPALILDNAIGAVEVHANHMLEELDSSLRVSLQTQRQTQRGDATETLQITVSDGAGEPQPLASFGGGQQYRVHLALRVGLARAIAGRGGPMTEVMLIDEVTDLDREGKHRLGELLSAWPSQVLIVSHDDALSDAMPLCIQVTPSGDAPSAVELL